jgi:hypothetical protein
MRRIGRILCLAVLLVAPHVALAEEVFDPKQVRVITPTFATSNCIGDPKTPICAVETFLACMARAKKSLCETIGVYKLSVPKKPMKHLRYQILSSRIIQKEDVTPALEDADWFKPGFAEIYILEPEHNPPTGYKFIYHIKPVEAGWKVISWYLLGSDEPPDDL